MKEACIVIPVYNNPETIGLVVRDALETGAEVVVVDDGSLPAVALPMQEGLHLLRHETNTGKGEAILSGGKKAKTLGYASFFVVDADGQHYAHEIENFMDADRAHCIVIGCRRFAENVPGSSKFGRAFSNFWVQVETGLSLRDTQSGFRSYPTTILDLPLRRKRYDFEIEVLVRHAWDGGCIEEADIEVFYPVPEERISHFHAFKDNVRLSLLHTRLVATRWLQLAGIGQKTKAKSVGG